jgi:predicted AlkP superfamily phosphohydrolase/phosphomutase
VLVNRALADAGLVEIEERDGRSTIAPSTPMAAMTGGASAQVYLNLEGREPGGVVSKEEAPNLLRRAARALADIGVEGEPVVEMIATEGQLRALGLHSPNSGDLVVFLNPGYTASSRLDGDIIRPSRYYGQHGYLSRHDSMCGIFLARGGPAGRGRMQEIRAIDVAPKVAAWLGLGF